MARTGANKAKIGGVTNTNKAPKMKKGGSMKKSKKAC